MTTSRKIAIIVGVLFLISYAGVFVGAAIVGSSLDASTYLTTAYLNQNQVVIGMLIEFLNDAAIVGIAVALFPLFRKHSESLALAYVSFRVIEAVMLMVSKVSLLALIPLSREYLAAEVPNAALFQASGAFALGQGFWAGEMGTVALLLGALILYYILFQSRLLPRFISVWGVIAVVSTVAARVFRVPDLTQGFEPAMALYFLIVANELFLAFWLLFKGFNSSPSDVEPEKLSTDQNKIRPARA
jgi:hypothetical protein